MLNRPEPELKVGKIKEGQLKEIIEVQTTKYLNNDNPETPNVVKQLCKRILTGSGEAGREAANSYLSQFNLFSNEHSFKGCEEIVANRVLAAIFSTSENTKNQKIQQDLEILGNSKSYRYRLLLAICIYYGADEQELNDRVNKGLTKILRTAGNNANLNHNEFKLIILKDIFKEIKPSTREHQLSVVTPKLN